MEPEEVKGPCVSQRKTAAQPFTFVQVYFSGWPPLLKRTYVSTASSQERPVKILTAQL